MRPEPSRRAAAALAAFAWVAATGAPVSVRAADSPQQEIEGALMCYCGCANLTVRDCSCGTAAKIKADIASRLAAGEGTDAVVAAYVAQHGEQIRSAPERSGFNLMAWIMPFAAILAGAVMIVALTRRWQARGASHAAGPDDTARVAGAGDAPHAAGPDDAAGAAGRGRVVPGGGPAATADPADREDLDRIEREIRETL